MRNSARGRSTLAPAVIYYCVRPQELFRDAAQSLFNLVQNAQRVRPGMKRVLHLDIEGHRKPNGRYDNEIQELESFIDRYLKNFLTEAHLPCRVVVNPVQTDFLPHHLDLQSIRR